MASTVWKWIRAFSVSQQVNETISLLASLNLAMGKINEFKSLSAIALDNGHFLFGSYCKQKLKVTQPLGRATLVLLKSGDFALKRRDFEEVYNICLFRRDCQSR